MKYSCEQKHIEIGGDVDQGVDVLWITKHVQHEVIFVVLKPRDESSSKELIEAHFVDDGSLE